MDDLLAEFVAETREMLDALGGELVAWEADPADRERLDQIFRFAHTVKGSCGFFDFPRLEKLSHAAEEALDEVRRGNRQASPALVTAVLRVIDRITDHINAIDAGEELPAGGDEHLIAALAADAEDVDVAPLAALDSDAGLGAAEESEAERPRAPVVQRSIRLPVELLDRMMSGVSDLVLARNDLGRGLREMGGDPVVDGTFERMSAILDEVRDAVTRMRMQRIELLFSSLPRLVRDLSRELDKQVLVDFEGGDVELDREMVESIRDPLTHAIRNAVDHGFEPAAERRAAGKPDVGTLTIGASQAGNQIYLNVRDDGRGIDAEKVAAKALEKGLVDAKQLKAMSTREKANLVFLPGFSTAETVTAVSGRGVGMDVVRANIEKVGGGVELSSKPGEGTSLVMRLPLTLSIIDTLSVDIAGQRFVMPRSGVEEIVLGADEDRHFHELGDGTYLEFRGKRVPCLELERILELDGGIARADRTYVVVRFSRQHLIAFAVDAVIDHEEAVIKPIAPELTATGLYTGATLLNDGTPVLALDIASIGLRSGLMKIGKGLEEIAGEIEASGETGKTADIESQVMHFIGFDDVARCIPMSELARIETIDAATVEKHAGTYRAVIEGTLRVIAGLAGEPPADGKLRLLRFERDGREAFYAIRAIVDVAEATGGLVEGSGEALTKGYVVIGGKPVPMIDTAAIAAEAGQVVEAGR